MDTTPPPKTCPKCQAMDIKRVRDFLPGEREWWCLGCGHQWAVPVVDPWEARSKISLYDGKQALVIDVEVTLFPAEGSPLDLCAARRALHNLIFEAEVTKDGNAWIVEDVD